MTFTLNDYKRAAEYISCASPCKPKVAIVLGSGLGGFAQRVKNVLHIPYSKIPNFPVSTAPSHAGEMIIGDIDGIEVCVLSGRFHYYEGWSFEESAFYVGVLKLIGVKSLIITNAAGCINADFNEGDLMLVSDHINFSGLSPMRGTNIEELGSRFFDMTDAYSTHLRALASACATNMALNVRQGVYAYMTGPQYETPAEIRALSIMGADAVGMSTVPEVIAAAHCGIKVLCISCLTNYASGITGRPLSGEEVTKLAQKQSKTLGDFIEHIIKKL